MPAPACILAGISLPKPMGPRAERAGKDVEVECKQLDKKGEDFHATLVARVGSQEETVHLALVADGHGGSKAASMCAASLLQAIGEEAKNSTPAELSRALRACFLSMHRTICDAGTTSGAAVTVIAIVPATSWLVTANVGDAVSISCRPCGLLL